MSLRGWMNEHPAATVVGAAAFLALVIGAVLLRGGSGPGALATEAYFLDLNTGKLFDAKVSEIPPIAAPSGKPTAEGEPAGVRARVFSCGSCRDASKRYTGFLETNTQDAKAAITGMSARGRRGPATPGAAAPSGRAPGRGSPAAPAPPQAPAEPAPSGAEGLPGATSSDGAGNTRSPMMAMREAVDRGRLVAKAPAAEGGPVTPDWVPASSPEGAQIVNDARLRCGQGTAAQECHPR